jgi:hypothetical protein
MMIFLYGMRNLLNPDEPLAQVRVPAETEPIARKILQKSFNGVLSLDTRGDDPLEIELIDVQDVTDPEIELDRIFVLTGAGLVWTKELSEIE